jgi:hypothetical protein
MQCISSFIVARFEHVYISVLLPQVHLLRTAVRYPRVARFPTTMSFPALYNYMLVLRQLDTAPVRHSRSGDTPPWCHFGCDGLENAHHVFVHCPSFEPIRSVHNRKLLTTPSGIFGRVARKRKFPTTEWPQMSYVLSFWGDSTLTVFYPYSCLIFFSHYFWLLGVKFSKRSSSEYCDSE